MGSSGTNSPTVFVLFRAFSSIAHPHPGPVPLCLQQLLTHSDTPKQAPAQEPMPGAPRSLESVPGLRQDLVEAFEVQKSPGGAEDAFGCEGLVW